MSRHILFLLFSIIVLPSIAQTPSLVPYRKGDLWGYADRGRNIIITPVYLNAQPFLDRITGVSVDSTTQIFIDSTGKQVGLAYKGVGLFSEGLCQVEKNNLQGYINNKGTLVIPMKFQTTHPFNEGLATVKDNNLWGVIDKSGKYVLQPVYDNVSDKFKDGFLYVEQKGRRFFIDRKGKEFKLPPHMKMLSEFSDGLAPVEVTIYKNDTSFSRLTHSLFADSIKVAAFVDKSGKIRLGPFESRHDIQTGFQDGFCVIQSPLAQYYLLSKNGKKSNHYQGIRPFSGGHAIVQNSTYSTSYYYVIDSSYQVRIINGAYYSDAGSFSEGLAPVKDYYTSRIGYINTSGELVISYRYTETGGFNNGIATVKYMDKLGYIDTKGNEYWE